MRSRRLGDHGFNIVSFGRSTLRDGSLPIIHEHRSRMSWAKLNQISLPIRIHIHLPGRVMMVAEGEGMGDKGGKKDKEKNKQQQLTKHKQEEQKKQDKARPKTP